MKKLKFSTSLINDIISGKKKNTWRINDDKNLLSRDKLLLCDNEGKEFAKAVIISIKERILGELNNEELTKIKELNEKYYHLQLNKNTKLKIIDFKLL